MSSDEKALDFPRVEVPSEENARRVMVEATRLASLAPGEWRLWIDRSAEQLGIPRLTLEDLIAAIIKDSEKKARDAETAAFAPAASVAIGGTADIRRMTLMTKQSNSVPRWTPLPTDHI